MWQGLALLRRLVCPTNISAAPAATTLADTLLALLWLLLACARLCPCLQAFDAIMAGAGKGLQATGQVPTMTPQDLQVVAAAQQAARIAATQTAQHRQPAAAAAAPAAAGGRTRAARGAALAAAAVIAGSR